MLRQASLAARRAAGRGIASFASGRQAAVISAMVRKPVKVDFEGGAGSARVAPSLLKPKHGRSLSCSASSGDDMGHMEPPEAFELLQTEGWKFVDVRTEEEFAAGHVEDSVNIPVFFFSDAGMTPNTKFVEQLRAAVPDKTTKLIMGCKIGQRSMMAGQLALNDQYDEVHNMTGGMIRWAESGLPIQQ